MDRAPARRRLAVETDRARFLAEAQSANRLKDGFLATVSHELCTPLHSLLGWARLLRSGSLDAAQTKRAAEAIERNVEAQARLVEDLLDFSRIITGKLHLDVQPIVLADAVVISGAGLEAARIHFDREVAGRAGLQFPARHDARKLLVARQFPFDTRRAGGFGVTRVQRMTRSASGSPLATPWRKTGLAACASASIERTKGSAPRAAPLVG